MKEYLSSFWMTAVSGFLITSMTTISTANAEPTAAGDGPRFPVLSNAEAWQRLPAPVKGNNEPLPTWARMLAAELPRATAAFLELDLAQRTKSPVEPGLRAAMRWVAAEANHCTYAQATAAADAVRVGVPAGKLEGLKSEGYPGWSPQEKAALAFARKMSVDSDSVTDAEFAELVTLFGDRQAASMVLMMAYANFQDRFLLAIGAPLEAEGPTAPVDVDFSPESFVIKTTPPPPLMKVPLPKPNGQDQTPDDPEWAATSYDMLQQRLESQRTKPTRLPVPTWDKVARNLPPGLISRPSDIVWYRIVFGYAPELAVPFEVFMRTAGAETSPKWDRIFGQSLFWVTTRAVKCPYCMGHCEMNWEVAGLTAPEIAERSRLLASDDWSSFTVPEQHAFAFARKLTSAPWTVSSADTSQLKEDFGADRALIVLLNASRYHYMTRISNGFQLTLERDNVFYDYYNVKSPEVAAASSEDSPVVPLLSVEETWKRMPPTVAGGGQTLPNWARAVAGYLPRTAAAMLQLDHAHRTRSPIDPVLRAKMRWVIAHANRCLYSEAYALADLKRAGLPAETVRAFASDPSSWPESDREPLEFARLLTVAAPTIPDAMFEHLKERFGNKQVAAMVLLAAYGNFQDRLVLGLKLPIEVGGPLPPLVVQFRDDAFQVAPIFPPQASPSELVSSGKDVVDDDQAWTAISYEQLQARLEQQRSRHPRLPVPTWDEVKLNLPAAMAARPTRIVWNLVCSGYVPELAIPWSISTRTMWSETKPDRVLEESLFWIQTRAIECNYCMGHCEMLLEVAGLDQKQIAARTKLLAGSDWSAFPPAEQRAFAYARKLSQTPWDLTAEDYKALEADFGPDKAMATFWWLCRGLYMTRVSDGFQLPLERENVFANPPVKTSEAAKQP